jgi:hypothetical protein
MREVEDLTGHRMKEPNTRREIVLGNTLLSRIARRYLSLRQNNPLRALTNQNGLQVRNVLRVQKSIRAKNAPAKNAPKVRSVLEVRRTLNKTLLVRKVQDNLGKPSVLNPRKELLRDAIDRWVGWMVCFPFSFIIKLRFPWPRATDVCS